MNVFLLSWENKAAAFVNSSPTLVCRIPNLCLYCHERVKCLLLRVSSITSKPSERNFAKGLVWLVFAMTWVTKRMLWYFTEETTFVNDKMMGFMYDLVPTTENWAFCCVIISYYVNVNNLIITLFFYCVILFLMLWSRYTTLAVTWLILICISKIFNVIM